MEIIVESRTGAGTVKETALPVRSGGLLELCLISNNSPAQWTAHTFYKIWDQARAFQSLSLTLLLWLLSTMCQFPASFRIVQLACWVFPSLQLSLASPSPSLPSSKCQGFFFPLEAVLTWKEWQWQGWNSAGFGTSLTVKKKYLYIIRQVLQVIHQKFHFHRLFLILKPLTWIYIMKLKKIELRRRLLLLPATARFMVKPHSPCIFKLLPFTSAFFFFFF